MSDHKNDERTVRCPVEGCDSTPLARGVHLHILRSSGDGHGPQNEVPDHISLDDLKTAGEREVKMDYPEERDNEKHARLCPYCSETFAGIPGLMIHLGQTAGRKNHPENPKEKHNPEDFPRVEVDSDGNVKTAVDSAEATSTDNIENAVVPEARVFRLLADLVADDEADTAHRVRRALLGDDDVVNPGRKEQPYSDLFDALLAQGRAEVADSVINAALENEGVMVACRGESAFLSANEARGVAAQLEGFSNREYWGDDDILGLIRFLRHSVDVLNRDETQRNLHVEFENWR